MKYKFLILAFFVMFILLVFTSISVLWFVDPLRLFHKEFLCENATFDDGRYEARGLIYTKDFDSIVLTTSMLGGISEKEAGEKLDGKFINIGLSGGNLYERHFILKYLLKYKDVKTVVYSLEKSALINDADNYKTMFPVENYNFLYDDNFFNDFKAYWNFKYIAYSIKTLITFGTNCFIRDHSKARILFPEQYLRYGGIENWAKHMDSSWAKIDAKRIHDAATGNLNKPSTLSFKENVYDNLIYFAKNYPQTNFILIIPPYPRVTSAIYFKQPELFTAQKNAIKYILEQKLANIKIYAFDDMDFTADIANYKDLKHYEPEMCSNILDWVVNDIGLLTLENFESWWQNYEKLVKDFDLEGFNNELQRLIKENKESGIPK